MDNAASNQTEGDSSHEVKEAKSVEDEKYEDDVPLLSRGYSFEGKHFQPRPISYQFSPCGSILTFLHTINKSNLRHLHALNTDNMFLSAIKPPSVNMDTEDTLSLEEKLRRERMRQMVRIKIGFN